MNGIWYYVIAFFVIWAFALAFKIPLEKFGVEVNFPLLMWKTTRLRSFIDRIANRAPRFWKWFMNIGIVISVFFMVSFSLLMLKASRPFHEQGSMIGRSRIPHSDREYGSCGAFLRWASRAWSNSSAVAGAPFT